MGWAGRSAAVILAMFVGGWTLVAAGSAASGDDLSSDRLLNRWRDRFPTTNADNRDSHNMAWDADSQRMVLFGGHAGGCQVANCFNKTYVYDLPTNNWTTLALYPNMEKRAEFGMAYDSRHDRIVTFGGPANYPGGGPSVTDWTWTFDYDNLTWSNLTSSLAQRPAPAGVCRIAYDSDSDRTIFWRPGLLTVHALGLDAMTWESLSPPAPRPPDGSSYSMSYDSLHDRVIVTVIPWGPGAQRQTWAYDYDSNSWQQRATTGPVPANDASGGAIPWAVYDAASDRTVMYMDDRVTWTYDWNTDVWYDMGVTGPPGHHFTLVYVPGSDLALFYGGAVGSNRNTWVYELTPPDVSETGGVWPSAATGACVAALIAFRRSAPSGRSPPPWSGRPGR
jgi:hypothetical protein